MAVNEGFEVLAPSSTLEHVGSAQPHTQQDPWLLPLTLRDVRQITVYDWAAAAFGTDHAASIHQRGVRFLEEAIELYQACGGERDMAHKLLDFIFERPSGEIEQEVGGAGLTLLALAHAARVSADAEEAKELRRVLSKSLAHFHARNEAKNAAGFDVTHGAYPTDGRPDDRVTADAEPGMGRRDPMNTTPENPHD